MKLGTLTSVLTLGMFVSGAAFATGTYYEGLEGDKYVITLGGADAEHKVTYTDKAKIDNNSGQDTVTIRNAIFENITDTSPTATGAVPDYGSERGAAVSTLAPINGVTNSVFRNNTAKPESGFAYGAAIHQQEGTVGLITNSTFDTNKAISEAGSRAWGGAIHSNRADFEGIVNSTFTNNLAETNSSGDPAEGGAIAFNGGWLKKIEGTIFDGNKSIATGGATAWGGAVYLYSAGMGDIISYIDPDTKAEVRTVFRNNYAQATPGEGVKAYAQGGALSLSTDVWNSYYEPYEAVRVYADFSNNHARASYNALGGAFFLSTSDYQPDIQGTYSNNYANGDNFGGGGAIWIGGSSTVHNITSTFTGNYAASPKTSYGGAIDNRGTITSITGSTFTGNHAGFADDGEGGDPITVYANGGAIFNGGTIESITDTTFTNNSVFGVNGNGGAILNNGDINKLVATFTGNNNTTEDGADAWGGAIIAFGGTINGLSATFTGNWAKGSNAQGGAIDNYAEINMVADRDGTDGYKASVVFKDNYIIKDGSTKQYEAIYNGEGGSITLEARKGGSYTFYDYINGEAGSELTFTGDGTGTFNLYEDVKGQTNINFDKTEGVFGTGHILNMISSDPGIREGTPVYTAIKGGTINVNSALIVRPDVDLANTVMDHFEADTFNINDGGSILIKDIVLHSNAEGTTYVPFIIAGRDDEDKLKVKGLENVSVEKELYGKNGDIALDGTYYNVDFIASTGDLQFSKVPAEKVEATEASAVTTNNTQNSVDAMNTKLVNREINKNMLSFQGIASGDEMIVTSWVEAFGSKNDVKLKNLQGAIDTTFYGVVGGFDSKKFMYGNGIQAIYGVYGAYVISKQKYGQSRINQRGEYLGASVAFKKGNVSNTIAGNVGYLHNEAETSFGKDKFETKVISISDKVEVALVDGKWTYTPALYLGYTGVDSDDYTTKAQTKIENKFMHVFTVAPELKIARDFGSGLSAYAKLAYKMFFYAENKIKANGVLLQEMSVKPYVEYGLGINKDWSQEEWGSRDITTYGEIVRHDGGREGWDVNLGLKLDF